jgi:hypothetical protein
MPLIRPVVCCAAAVSSICRATAPANRRRSNALGTVNDPPARMPRTAPLKGGAFGYRDCDRGVGVDGLHILYVIV